MTTNAFINRAHHINENETAKVPVSCHEQLALFLGDSEQLFVASLRESDLRDRNGNVPQMSQEARCRRVYVLVKQELHAGLVVR